MPKKLLDEILREAVAALGAAGVDNPDLDARILVARVMKRDRAWIAAHGDFMPDKEQLAAIGVAIKRRTLREPVGRILGTREFWGMEIGLNSATLEPRPDSETLISATMANISVRQARRILDLGTGSGCLLLALLRELPEATGLGIDFSPDAVLQASANAVRHGLQERAEFRTGHWLDGVAEKFDLIISNPPYIPAGEIAGLMPEVRDYDPLLALDGGTDGLDAYRTLIPLLAKYLNRGGLCVFEVGAGQAELVADMMAKAGLVEIALHKDYGGVKRCVSAGVAK